MSLSEIKGQMSNIPINVYKDFDTCSVEIVMDVETKYDLIRNQFSSDQLISSFLSKIFAHKMCSAWSKQLENEGIEGII